MTDPFYVYRPVLDLLGKSEGTAKGRGYNETLAYGAYTGGHRNLVTMTLADIDELQRAMLVHPANRLNSSALGLYQIVRKTRVEIEQKLRLRPTDLFDEAMQDRMACYLLGKRGIDQWLAKTMSDVEILNSLAKEWASLPTSKGIGHYNGQRASVSVSEVLDALAQVRQRRGATSSQLRPVEQAKPAPAPKPSPPPANQNTAPTKKGGWWAAIQALFGGRSK
ncbi:hypothetical protein [Devosia sp.]|uniref:hypothetical protein n=1 Tax=Devosia sp. TaxID=1871048 RepID=UPI001AD48754|nr:hypothetical protein [Devosia sp.]MBN9333879.1 hypothetical protein [Devosia sp.]